MRLIPLAVLSLLWTCARAQTERPYPTDALPAEIVTLLDTVGVSLYGLDAGDFRIRENRPNDYLDDQLTLYSKDEKLELRFHLRPARAGDPMAELPHLRAHTLAMNLGSNDEDAVTTVHSFGPEELAVYGADWARMYTFRPKRSYSERAHAQFIAVYRKGRGTVYSLLLFDRTPPTLEDRQLTTRFR